MRTSRTFAPILGLLSAGLIAGTAHAAPGSPIGVWIDHTGRGGVEIKDCGNGKLCGHVVWIKDNKDAKGCGLQILGNVASIGSGQWDNGWIYSPEKKQKFSVELTPLDQNRLRVKGYKGIKLLSRTMIWHRASSTLSRCDQVEAKAKSKPAQTAAVAKPSPPASATEPAADAPKLLNPENGTSNTPLEATKDGQDRARHARIERPTEPAPAQDRSDDIYAAAPPSSEPDADRDRDQGARSGDIDGLASLLENFTKGDGVEVGDGYGMKVEKGKNGEKNCRLDVPFVTVRFPCED